MLKLETYFHKIHIKSIILALIVVTCAIQRDFDFYVIEPIIQRPYGSSLVLSIPMFLLILLLFFNRFKIKNVKKTLKMPLSIYLLWGIANGVIFFLVNSNLIHLIAVFKIFLCLAFYIVLCGVFDFSSYIDGIELGFKIGIILQTITGVASVFWGIVIPFLGRKSTAVRNGISRMEGTFIHPGDFSLYIAILTLFFLCKYIFAKDRIAKYYVIAGMLDILYSGARTMLFTIIIVTFIVLIHRKKSNTVYRLGMVVAFVIGGIAFVNSDIFYDLVIKHSAIDMLYARLVHWIIGIKIMFRNVFNLFLGVGLNGHVDYIDANFNEFKGTLSYSVILDSDFARRSPIHNSFLIIGSELGIFGLILYLRVYYINVKKLMSNAIRPLQMDQVAFLISAHIVFTVYAMQGWAIQKDFGLIMLAVLCSYTYQLFNRQRKLERRSIECE